MDGDDVRRVAEGKGAGEAQLEVNLGGGATSKIMNADLRL